VNLIICKNSSQKLLYGGLTDPDAAMDGEGGTAVEEESAGEAEEEEREGPGAPDEDDAKGEEGTAIAGEGGGREPEDEESAGELLLPELAPKTFFAVSAVRIMFSMLKMTFFTASLLTSFKLFKISAMLHLSVSNSGFANPIN
jgi:hypothetical protein